MTKRDPILKEGESEDYGRPVVVRAIGGLHFLSGNRLPYFSLTGETRNILNPNTRKPGEPPATGRVETCGCIHETLLRVFPDLAPLAALHLSDITGEPSHAAGNGVYWLAGSLASPHAPNLKVWGSEYHGASGRSGKSPAECLTIAARHFRRPESELAALAEGLRYAAPAHVREKVAAYCEGLRPQWKREADSAIAQFGLVIFGDVPQWEARQRAALELAAKAE